jgi:TetR/AcrR family transcriptional regulator, tetracycline repressor protein
MRIRKSKAPHIEPEAVVRAALEILDAEGLEHVTLRRISSKLGVQAPALYWHFKNKEDIIDDTTHAILVQGGLDNIGPPKETSTWTEWLIDTARIVRGAMVSHRDGGRVVAGASFRAKTLAKIAILTTRILNEAGFDLLHAGLATSTIFDYVWGYVIEEQAGMGPDPKSANTLKQEINSPFSLDLEDENLLDAVVKEANTVPATEKFDWGLRVIVTGLELALNKDAET